MENEPQIDQLLTRIAQQREVFKQEEMRQQLIAYITYLFLNDFNRLVQLLYRVDVKEDTLKQQLKENSQTESAVVITDLLISRQKEKLALKSSTPPPPESKNKEEKW